MRRAKIYFEDTFCGMLLETDIDYVFIYDDEYLNNPLSKPISLLMPTSNKEYHSKVLFPFFDGLIPEGYLEGIAIKKWNLNIKDRFMILLKTGNNTIGAVKVVEE